MRLISNIVGEETFKSAVLEFLSLYRNSAVSYDLFLEHLHQYSKGASLPQSMTLSKVISKYVNAQRPFAELVRVRLEGNLLSLVRVTSEKVDLPLDFITSENETAVQAQHWIADTSDRTSIVLTEGTPTWVALNNEQFGLYQVDYSVSLWKEFQDRLLVDHERFNRAKLISDSSTIAFAGRTSLDNYLNLIRYLPEERDWTAWRAARISYEKMAMNMRGYNGNISLFHSYFSNLTEDVYLKNRIDGQMKDFALVMEVAKIACYSGEAMCVYHVQEHYDVRKAFPDLDRGSNDFQTFVYCTLAQHSEKISELAEDVLQMWVKDGSLTTRVRNAILGLACTSEPEVITK